MRFLSVILLAFVLVSCENETAGPGFTEKWWKSDKEVNYFVRFNDNGEYIKVFELNFILPVSMPQTPSRLMQIEGEWSLNDNQIIFESVNIVNDSSYNITGTDYFSSYFTSGYPIGSFYDTNRIRYWRPDPNDTLSGSITRFAIDTVIQTSPPVIWVISEISQDTLKLIINSHLETFSHVEDIE